MTIGKCDLVKRKAKNGIGGKIHVTLIRPKGFIFEQPFYGISNNAILVSRMRKSNLNLDVAMYGFVTKFSL